MLVSEKEAKEMWCPFAKGYIGEVEVGNRSANEDRPIPFSCRCIGADCMLWSYLDSALSDLGYCGMTRKSYE